MIQQSCRSFGIRHSGDSGRVVYPTHNGDWWEGCDDFPRVRRSVPAVLNLLGLLQSSEYANVTSATTPTIQKVSAKFSSIPP